MQNQSIKQTKMVFSISGDRMAGPYVKKEEEKVKKEENFDPHPTSY